MSRSLPLLLRPLLLAAALLALVAALALRPTAPAGAHPREAAGDVRESRPTPPRAPPRGVAPSP